ncbi:MAG: hypothetical protein ABIO72_00190 [Patescibacteria group bacterium]
MEKRTKFGLLILLALIILGFGIWYLFQPYFRTVQQPPSLPNNVIPSNTVPTSTVPQIPVGGGTTVVPQDIQDLQTRTKNVISMIGSGSNSNGFAGYSDALVFATANEQIKLKAEQAALQQAHPVDGPTYGMTTKTPFAPKSISAEPGAATMIFSVQAQRLEDNGDPTHTIVTYKEATVTFERQPDGTYLVSDVVWKDIAR